MNSASLTCAGRARDLLRLAPAAVIAAALVALGAPAALALSVYGSPTSVAGAAGCVRAASEPPDASGTCAGRAEGLGGAEAIAVTPDGRNVYIAGEEGVVALDRDLQTGALGATLSPSFLACVGDRQGGPCATVDPALDGADALAVSSDGRFVYVGAADSATVSAFLRTSRGTLRPLPPSVGSRSERYFGCIAGTQVAGAPQSGCEGRMPALNGVDAVAISPDGRNLYAVSYGNEPGEDSIVALQRNPRTGALRALGGAGGCLQSRPGHLCRALAGLEGASAVAISPDGRFVYVASEVSGAVRVLRRSWATGALTPIYGRGDCISSDSLAQQDIPCSLVIKQLSGARSLAFSRDGSELYVAAFEPGAVVVLRRNRASGLLSIAPATCLQAAADAACPTAVVALRGASALALSADGSVVYAVSEGGNSLFELDAVGGGLSLSSATPSATVPLGGPVALSLSPSLSPGAEDIYVISPFDNGVAALAG